MAYAIKVQKGALNRVTKKPINGWISKWGYTVAADPDYARRFGKRTSAEAFALLLAVKCPHYLGRLSIGVIVVGSRPGDVRWREKKGWKEIKET